MCGEMAGEPLYVPILIGLELDDLSMNVLSIFRVKKILRAYTFRECKELVEASQLSVHAGGDRGTGPDQPAAEISGGIPRKFRHEDRITNE